MDAKTEKKVKVLTQKVKDYLKSLGAGPNKVAESLKKQKIKGYIGDIHLCPLAKALKKKFKAVTSVCVSTEVEVEAYGEDIIIEPPSACDKFINNFDNRKYPDLFIEEE